MKVNFPKACQEDFRASHNVNLFFNCIFFFFFFFFFRAALVSSQGRDQIRATAASLRHSHSNSRSLTHWVRPGIKPAFSWKVVRFITAEPQWELLASLLVGLFALSLQAQYHCFFAGKLGTSVAILAVVQGRDTSARWCVLWYVVTRQKFLFEKKKNWLYIPLRFSMPWSVWRVKF